MSKEEPLDYRRISRNLALAVVLGIVYFIAGKFGLSLAIVNPSATAVWAPSGIALAAFLVLGYRVWPAIVLGAFAVNITTAGSVLTSTGIAVGNTLEGLVGAYLVNRFARGRRAFDKPQHVLGFVLLAGIVSTAVSPTLGVTSLALGGFANWENYPAIWLTWWLGDMVGNVIVAPLLLVWMTQPFPRLRSKQILEGTGLLLIVVLVSMFVFLGESPLEERNAPMGYMALLPLLWAAFRFGQRGAVTCAFLTSGVALWGTSNGLGQFVTPDPNRSLLFLQVFMGTITVAALVLASVVSQRAKAEKRLQVQDAVSRVLAESSTLREAAPKIIQALCEMAGWEIGAIWNLDRMTNELSCVEVWHRPFLEFPEFVEITRHRKFSSGVGLPGRVLSSAKPEWVPDVTRDDNFPRAPVASREGLHAAFCFPLKLGNEILGVIECFSREVREPDEHLLQMLPAIGSQLGQFIERKRAEQEMRISEDHNTAVLKSALDGLITIDHMGMVVEFNPAAEKIFGYRHEDVIGKEMAELIIPPYLRERHRQGIRHYLATGEGPALNKRIEMIAMRADGSEFSVELSIIRVGTETPPTFTGFVRDITKRKQAEIALRKAQSELEVRVKERTSELARVNDELRLMQTIALSIGQINTMDEALEIPLREICESTGFVLGQAWVYNHEEGHFLCAPAWYASMDGLDEFRSTSLGLVLSMNEGLPGYTGALQRVHWIKDFERDVGVFKRGESAHRAGLRSAMAVPIMAGNDLVAVIEFFAREPMEEDPRIVSLISAIAAQLGPVLQRKRIEEQLRVREGELDEARQKRSADLRRYARSVQRVQEEERQRIARELHDDLCQRLSGMKLNVEVIADGVEALDKALYRKLQGFNKQCEEMITEVRRMSVNLRPAVLDDFGLAIALELLTTELEKLHKIRVTLKMDATARLRLEPQVEIALYRIAQEALSNIVKHAQASEASVALHKNGQAVVLIVDDNGKGLNLAETGVRKESHSGLGLISMRERTELLGGTFSVKSAPDQGTSVTATIPLITGMRYEEDTPAHR